MLITGSVYADPLRAAEALYEYRRFRRRKLLWAAIGAGVFLVCAVYSYGPVLHRVADVAPQTAPVSVLAWLLALSVGAGVVTWWVGRRPAITRWRSLLADGALVRDAYDYLDEVAPYGRRPDPSAVWTAVTRGEHRATPGSVRERPAAPSAGVALDR